MQRMVIGALAALAAVMGSAPAAASLELTVAPDSVSIAVAPSSRVAVVGLMRRSHGKIPGFERWEGILADDDGDGQVVVTLEHHANPEASQWVAVDLASGEWAVGGRFSAGEPAGLLPTGNGLSSGSSLWPVPEGIVEVLVVRPGEGEAAGAWGGGVWDGGPEDGDGLADGSAGVASAALRSLGSSGPPPETFAAGDVLIAVSPRGLRHGITKVAEGTEGVTQ